MECITSTEYIRLDNWKTYKASQIMINKGKRYRTAGERECKQASGAQETSQCSSPVFLFAQGCILSPDWITKNCVMIDFCFGRGI